MASSTLLQFESALYRIHPNPLEELWEDLRPCFNEGKVASRGEAYVLFAKALKMTQLAVREEELKGFWINLLHQGSFSLCLENKEPIHYRFHTIVDLLQSGRQAFEADIVEVDPGKSNLADVAEAMHSIALSSLGSSPCANRFQTIITAPNTMCLLAQERDNFIACTYGSYLETPGVKFFHLNFLGRKVEYPSIHIIEKLQGEAIRIQKRFPDVQYLTLCVNPKNEHMMPVYKELGFEQLEYIEAGADDSLYFYGKKIDQNSHAKAPSYLEYKTALEALRSKK